MEKFNIEISTQEKLHLANILNLCIWDRERCIYSIPEISHELDIEQINLCKKILKIIGEVCLSHDLNKITEV